ncbi:MAG TPA: ABC-2 family transporter protein [Patescibacteria group bacterium]|nr:ABC-2 family transporter protein [Patescibacteria group bacterium]
MISSRAAQSQLINPWSALLFLLGKIIRFLLFFVFLFKILSTSGSLGEYGKEAIIIFFLVFNLIDILTQFLFRGVYHFRPLIVSGDYDLDLLKPLPSFFRPIFGWTDILDLITLVPLWFYFLWFLGINNLFNFSNLALFSVLIINSLFLSFAFHLFICAVCILTTEIDHLIWVYRDLTSMARFSTDIYPRLVRGILTFTIPVVVLITVPAKALLGLLSWPWLVLSLVIAFLALTGAFKFWRYALGHYASASS